MCVSIINGETDNHTIQEKEATKNEAIFEMDDSTAVLVQRELDKSTSLLRDCLAFGKEVFLGIARR